MVNFEKINQCPIFRGLDTPSAISIINSIHFQVKKFTKGDILATAGEKVVNLYIITEGSVKGEMIDYTGKTIKIEDIEAPKPLAAAFMFGEKNRYPVTVTANNDVKIISVPIEEFLKILQKNSTVLTNYLNSISTRAQFLSQKIQFLGFKTIRGKVAHFLLNKAGDRYHSVELKETQQQLADMFGVARPSLARVLGEMQKEGLIEIERKTIKLKNKAALNDLLWPK